MGHIDDIRIAEDTWIAWIPIDEFGNDEMLDIDATLSPTFYFWDLLETECIAACCGIHAYRLLASDIRATIPNIDLAQIEHSLFEAKQAVIASPKPVIFSAKLNQLFYHDVFIELINHILVSLSKARAEFNS
ncbi:MAG: hypothetical protein EOP06_24285 [Proteobacteria bacterium]|nr:MAG: hypothetical protein EOP06_24285 [Pseudomonadota bacterium]